MLRSLELQIESARRAARLEGESTPIARGGGRGDLFELSPQILTLCSGGLQPFDFGLSPEHHHELYLAGQLFVHLHAAHLSEKDADRPAPFPAVLSQEQKLKALLYVLHLDDGRPVAN